MTMRRILSALVLGSLSLGALAGCAPSVAEATLAASTPGREVGAACAFGDQCASGHCSADVASGACGVCLEVRKLGESCDGPLQTCNDSATCEDGACRSTKKVAGESCSIGPKGADLDECDDELYCAGNPGGQGSCAAPVPVGQPCETWTGRCVDGAYCPSGGVCTLPAADSCVSTGCETGYFCADNLTCRPATLPLGEPCGIVGGSFVDNECVAGSVCGNLEWPDGGGGPGTIHACVALPDAGEICIRGRCAEGLFCAEQTTDSTGIVPTRCEPLRGEGEACSTDYVFHIDCAAGLECRKGVCAAACR